MFGLYHQIACERIDRRLAEELGKIRLEMSDLRVDLLRWSFLFWIGQLAAMTAILSLLLRGIR